MIHKTIYIIVLLASFFQILHIFEEIGLNAYKLQKGKNPRGKYLRVASILVLLNYLVILFLFMEYKIAYYLAFYTVIISIGNVIAHLILIKKTKEKSGYGFFSSIPLGIAGIALLFFLVKYFTST